ncbi:MAG: hypothetical protein JW942_04680 [Opitutales bacterium]|nr:hypothetical protein [Opitutales bacterium]
MAHSNTYFPSAPTVRDRIRKQNTQEYSEWRILEHIRSTPETSRDSTTPRKRPGITEETIRLVGEHAAGGNTQETIAALCSVSLSTFEKWLGFGKSINESLESDSSVKEVLDELRISPQSALMYLRILRAYKKGKASASQRAIREIMNAGQRDWKAMAWYLERTDPQHFGRATRYESNVKPVPSSGWDNSPMTNGSGRQPISPEVAEIITPDLYDEVVAAYIERHGSMPQGCMADKMHSHGRSESCSNGKISSNRT